MKRKLLYLIIPLLFLCGAIAWAATTLQINLANVTNPAYLVRLLNQMDAQVDSLISQKTTNDYVWSDPAIAVYNSSGTHKVQTDSLYYIINGCLYYKATGAVTLSGSAVPQAKYGAFALQVGTDGTIDVVAATDNATGYSSAALAVAGLPARASNHARLGYLTVIRSSPNGTFIPGQTQIGASGVTAAYTDYTAASNIVTDIIARGK